MGDLALKYLPSLAVLAKGLAVAVPVYLVFQPIKRWRLRHLPGPRNLPLIGNIPELIASGDAVVYQKDLVAKYGKIFKLWLGSTCNVMISDPVALRKLLLQCVSRPDRDMFVAIVGEPYHAHKWNMLWMNGKHPNFKTMRRMFEYTLLNPKSLACHAGVLNEIASRLVRHVTSFAASGETFDASIMCADMAMEAIGFAAFGLDMNCLGQASAGISLAEAAGGQAPPPVPTANGVATVKTEGSSSDWLRSPLGSPEFTKGLVRTCRDLFIQTDISHTTRWSLLTLLFPELCRPISHIANVFAGKRLRKDRQTRQDIIDALRLMARQWKESKKKGGVNAIAMSDLGFLPQLLTELGSGKDGVDEIDIISQAFLMLLAGYETTSSALSIALHLLSHNPETQKRAQQEVDTVLQGKEMSPDDLERLPYIKAVFDETVRLYPMAAPVIMRELAETQEVEIDGKTYRLPAGTAFVANAYEMQRNAEYWPRPDEFLPERHIQPGNEAVAAIVSSAYVPFGHGPRKCPGFKFAQLEARLALAKLMQNYTFKPAPGCAPPRFKSGIVYIPDHVWLVTKSRKAEAEQ